MKTIVSRILVVVSLGVSSVLSLVLLVPLVHWYTRVVPGQPGGSWASRSAWARSFLASLWPLALYAAGFALGGHAAWPRLGRISGWVQVVYGGLLLGLFVRMYCCSFR